MEWTALPKLYLKLALCMEGNDGKWLIIKQKPYYSCGIRKL
jgi:hypothetical protein